MAFFTRRGASSVPEPPASMIAIAANERDLSEEEAKKFNYLLDRDGVEV